MITSRIVLVVKEATAVKQAQQGPLIRARQPFKPVSWPVKALKAQTPHTCTSLAMELVRARATKKTSPGFVSKHDSSLELSLGPDVLLECEYAGFELPERYMPASSVAISRVVGRRKQRLHKLRSQIPRQLAWWFELKKKNCQAC